MWATWLKFKPVIEYYRKWEWPEDYFSNFEYLAEQLMKRQKSKDKNFMEKGEVVIMTHLKDDK